MAQGNLKKLKKPPRSAGSKRHKTVRSKTTQSKGRKQKNARRAQAVHSAKSQIGVTKSINKKNETLAAAKAIASGTSFVLKDLTDGGTKEHQKQLKARDKRQDKSTKLTGRLKEQIKQLQQGTKMR